MQISNLIVKNPKYPSWLQEIDNPPKHLYVMGKLSSSQMIAIVGSRKPSEYGCYVTHQLAYELSSAGITIVSGLAYGIDTVAHQAALDAKGITVAVLGCGLDRVYPIGNQALAKRIIAANGALLSEHPLGTPALKQHFPARNRIIAGLSEAVIVTEAAADSGALITANFALQQNRTVLAVPGNITSLLSAGTNNLIKAGAIPITSAADVLATLNWTSGQLSSKPIKAASAEEAMILELLAQGINASQELIQHSQMSAQQFANVITLMEISGKVRNLGAGTWVPK